MTATANSETIRNIRQSLHNLAQPLAVLAGSIDLLLLQVDEADPKLAELQMLSQQLEKVFRIVGEIRSMARDASPVDLIPPYAPQDQAR